MDFGKLGFIFGLTALISACGADVPDTPQGFRDYANAGGFMMDKKVFQVARSSGAVNASLREGARKCLNRTVTFRATYPQPSIHTNRYITTFKTVGGRGEMLMRQSFPAGPFFDATADGMRYRYIVDTVPSRGGTQVTIYGSAETAMMMGANGDRDVDAKVAQWAKGRTIRCPKMPE